MNENDHAAERELLERPPWETPVLREILVGKVTENKSVVGPSELTLTHPFTRIAPS